DGADRRDRIVPRFGNEELPTVRAGERVISLAPQAAPSPIKIAIRGIEMHFGRVPVLKEVSLDVREGELVCLVGPSGCGKSTLLNIVGGFFQPTGGEIEIDGEPVRGADPRRIFVFQERGVFPWLNVERNIGFGLRNLLPAERARTVARYVHLVGL